MNSSAVIFEKPKIKPKIADFAHFEPLLNLNVSLADIRFAAKYWVYSLVLPVEENYEVGLFGSLRRDARFHKFSSHGAYPSHCTFSRERKCL